MSYVDRDWNGRYAAHQTPWDSGRPSRELQNVLSEHNIPRGRALELGCGTGTNSVYLAQQGFTVTALDCSPLALEQGRRKARAAGVQIEFLEADVQNFQAAGGPFAFIFDRGCYHCCRKVNLPGYLQTLRDNSAPGTWFLCLAGNANEQTEEGPPRVTEQEIRNELGSLFEIVQLRDFRFQDADGSDGPLGWSALLRRDSLS